MPQESPITTLTTRVRQLIMEYKELCRKHESLKSHVAELNGEIAGLKEQLAKQQKEYDNLMTAKMLSISDTDIEKAKQRINSLQRSVTHCITLLTEKDAE